MDYYINSSKKIKNMKNLHEYLKINEGADATKNVIRMDINDELSLPVMIANDGGQTIWELSYLVARKEGKNQYKLYLVNEPKSKFTNNPVDAISSGHLVPVEIFDFENPANNLKYDFFDALCEVVSEHSSVFGKDEEIRVEL